MASDSRLENLFECAGIWCRPCDDLARQLLLTVPRPIRCAEPAGTARSASPCRPWSTPRRSLGRHGCRGCRRRTRDRVDPTTLVMASILEPCLRRALPPQACPPSHPTARWRSSARLAQRWDRRIAARGRTRRWSGASGAAEDLLADEPGVECRTAGGDPDPVDRAA